MKTADNIGNDAGFAEEYRRQRSELHFSEDFEETAARIMREAAEKKEILQSEGSSLQTSTKSLLSDAKALLSARKPLKVCAAAVLAVALLTSTAFAADAIIERLSPKQVAEAVEQEAEDSRIKGLAAAFDSPEATLINETVESGGWRITLLGITRGEEFFDRLELDPASLEKEGFGAQDGYAAIVFDPYMNAEPDAKHLYAAAAVEKADGSAVTDEESMPMLMVTIDGYTPSRVNSWTLGFASHTFVRDGVGYYMFDFDRIEIFADHTIRLMAYDGFEPDEKLLGSAENGEVGYAAGYSGTKAMFVLPVDPAKADKDAQSIAQLFEDYPVQYVRKQAE